MKTKKEIKRIELTPKQVQANIDKLTKGVMETYNIMQTLIPQVIIQKEIKNFGNASHIILPKEYAKKKAIIIIKK